GAAPLHPWRSIGLPIGDPWPRNTFDRTFAPSPSAGAHGDATQSTNLAALRYIQEVGPLVAACCLAWTMLAPPRDAVLQIEKRVDPGLRQFAEERKDAAFLWLGRLAGNG